LRESHSGSNRRFSFRGQPVQYALTLMALAVCAGVADEARAPRAAGPQEADRGVIAVLRRDGVMFPFATFRGTTWSAPWPGGVNNIELPINLASIPERWWGGWRPEAWQAWLTDGTARPIRALEPTQFRVHCGRRIGITTDYKAAEPIPMLPVNPFPKDGVAATAGTRIESIEIVGRSEEEWGALAIALLEDFDGVEDREVSAVAAIARWRHPTPAEDRHARPVRIESWYRTNVDDEVVASYIEAVRSYPPGPEDNGCGLETLFSGWVYHEKGKLARRDLVARLTYCDRVNATYMLPFGRMRLRDRVYWLAQLSGHEAEWYAVAWLDRRRARVVVEYFAGSLDSCR